MAEYYFKEQGRSRGWISGIGFVLLAALVVGGLGFVVWTWKRSSIPELAFAGTPPRAIAEGTPLRIVWKNPNGLRRLTVGLVQDGRSTTLQEFTAPTRRFSFEQPGPARDTLEITFRKSAAPGLRTGPAHLVIEAVSNDLRGRATLLRHDLPAVLEKPELFPEKSASVVRHGGTGVVHFTARGGWSSLGVRVGGVEFPCAAPAPQSARQTCLYSVPPAADLPATPVLFARGADGSEVTAAFPVRILHAPFRRRTLEVPSALIDKVTGELDEGGTGDSAERFLRINSAIRRANDTFLASLAPKSAAEPLWTGPFQLMPGTKAEANFADFRTYRHLKRDLGREWHLGIDMASVKEAPVPAANRGVVLHAGPLGIYGKCVVIDHGLGVQSVYGHLSRIRVRAGQSVSKGEEIGRTGMSGLAGGDHLHFGVLLQGTFVDPLEWADARWMAALFPVS